MSNIVLKLINPYNGEIRTSKLGFSWMVLFFDFCVPISRKDWGLGLVMFILSIATMGASSIFFAFYYNRIYTKSLIKKGYQILYFWGPLKYKHIKNLIPHTED